MNTTYNGFETRLLRFAIGWVVAFLVLFNPVGILLENLHWEYEAFILPLLCAVSAIFLIMLLGKWNAKQLTKAVNSKTIKRSRLRLMWSISALPIWLSSEREKFWAIWYGAAKERLVPGDTLYDSWQMILQIAGGELVEPQPEEIPEVEPEAIPATIPAEIIPEKVLVGGLQPAFRVAVPPPEPPVIMPVAPEPITQEPVVTDSELQPYRHDLDKWSQVISSSRSRKEKPKPDETIPIPFDQPSGISDEAEHHVHHEDFEMAHVVPEPMAPDLADTDHTTDFFVEVPAPPKPEIVEGEAHDGSISDTELIHVVPVPEAPSLADMDVHHVFVPEEPVKAVEEPIVVPITPVEEAKPAVPEFVTSFQFTPPKLPPLAEHPAFARRIEEPVAPRSTLPPPKRVYQSKARIRRESLKQILFSGLMVVLIIATGFGIFGLFRYVTNSLTNEPQLAAEANLPEPIPLQSLKFTIDLGERETLKEANKELEMLQDNGYAAYLYRELKRDGKMRMRVGHFAHKHDAQEVGRKMIDQRITRRFEVISSDSTETKK